MKSLGYKQWLESQIYQPSTITAQMHRVGRVEECYGDLDNHFDTDRLASVIESLVYTMDDRRKNRPNPTKIPFDGDPYKNIASYRDAVKRYCKFRLSGAIHDLAGQEVIRAVGLDDEVGQRIGLERDMQAALRIGIEQLEKGLIIIDEGAERSVDSGFIDITAADSSGTTVVIELKTGVAGQKPLPKF